MTSGVLTRRLLPCALLLGGVLTAGAVWAGDASAANPPENPIAHYHHLRHTAAPVSAAVRQAAARALRDARRWPEALALWREGLAQHPEEQAAFTAGLVLTLADAGQVEAAIQTGLDGVEQAPDSADLRLALAYAYARQGRAYEALFHADQARQLAPQAGWVQREYVLALQRAGVSGPAWRLAQAQRDLFTPAQLRALDADAAALKTRLAVMPTRREAERPLIAERALSTGKSFTTPAAGSEMQAVASEDVAAAMFKTERGTLATMTVSQVSAGRRNRLWFEIDGAKSSVAFDQEDSERLWMGFPDQREEIFVRGPGAGSAEQRRLAVFPAGHAQGYGHCFEAFIADTYQAIKAECPEGLPTFEDGLRSALIVDRVIASARARAWLPIG